MESQPQNPELRNNPENFHQCKSQESSFDVTLHMYDTNCSAPILSRTSSLSFWYNDKFTIETPLV